MDNIPSVMEQLANNEEKKENEIPKEEEKKENLNEDKKLEDLLKSEDNPNPVEPIPVEEEKKEEEPKEEEKKIIEEEEINPNVDTKLSNLKEIKQKLFLIKEEGNKFIKAKDYENAKNKYNEGINLYNESDIPKDENESEEIKTILKDINNYNTAFHGNISVVLSEQKKYQEAIEKAFYVINKCDENHINSYIRIITWYIELKKLNEAKEFGNMAEEKFKNNPKYSDIKQLVNKVDNLLKNKIQGDKKSKDSKGVWYPLTLGGISIGATALLFTLIYKYGKKYI